MKAQLLLMKCKGDEIWSVEVCRQAGIPEIWITELQGAFESGYDTDRNTLYVDERMVNQYHGVPDLQLAYRLAEYLGLDSQAITASALSRRAEVCALQEAFEEQ